MPDGTVPEPGGWNRFAIEVPDLEAVVSRLGDKGVRFRNQIVTGAGGRQILAEDRPATWWSCSNLHCPKRSWPGHHESGGTWGWQVRCLWG